MKLYRGIKSSEYIEHSEAIEKTFKDGWKEILKRRETGDFAYPEDLNDTIVELFKKQPFLRQYFTDNKVVANQYVKDESGLIIEVDVPIEDILNNFIIEFQNYSKRKEKFEVTYLVHSGVLFENKVKWGLKVSS